MTRQVLRDARPHPTEIAFRCVPQEVESQIGDPHHEHHRDGHGYDCPPPGRQAADQPLHPLAPTGPDDQRERRWHAHVPLCRRHVRAQGPDGRDRQDPERQQEQAVIPTTYH